VRGVPAEKGEFLLLYLQLAQQLLQLGKGEGALGLVSGPPHDGLQLPQAYVLRDIGLDMHSVRHQQAIEAG
jgi:hypothetical protein